MATNKPRITVTLNPHVYASFKRMSELGGQSMSSLISELLDTIHEPFMRTVALMEAAAEAPQQVRDGLKDSFATVERDLYSMVGYTQAQIDWISHELMKGEGGGKASKCAAAPPPSAPSNPHYVIRGSGSPKRPSKTTPPKRRKP